MFTFDNKEKAQSEAGFSGFKNKATLSFAIAEDDTSSIVMEGETVQAYAARHGDIPLTPLTAIPLGKARVLGEAASGKYEGICRSENGENDENDEPQRGYPKIKRDGIPRSLPAQNSITSTSTLALSQDNSTANMPPKITFKLESTTTEAHEEREASEKAEKSMKRKRLTAEEIQRDMSEAMTDWPDRPATPNGGDEYQENLYAEPRMSEKYRMLGDDIDAMRLNVNAPVYNEADYEDPGTLETPGKYADEEWETRTRFDDLQPTNFYTARPGVPMEFKTRVGMDASGWDIYSDDPPAVNVEDAEFEAMRAKVSPAPKEQTMIEVNREGWNIYVNTEEDVVDKANSGGGVDRATQCGMDHTKTCNNAICTSKTVAQTSTCSPFPTQPGLATASASRRNTFAPGWFSNLAGETEGSELVFDTSAPSFPEADRAARVPNINMKEAEKIDKGEAEKIAKKMADATDNAAEEDSKASKKRILMLMKKQKERERKEAEEAREKAAEDLRRLEEELAGL